MKMKHRLGALNIQLFAEGGAVGEGAAVGESQNDSGEKETVVYGKQPQEASDAGKNASQMQNEGTTPQSAEPTAPLTKGSLANDEGKADAILDNFYKEHPEAKKEADKRTAKAVQGRVYQMNKSMQKNEAVIQKLMVRHGVKSIEELEKVLDSDEVFESMASERGENPDTLRELERLRILEAQQNYSREQRERERLADEKYNGWLKEAEGVKATYPEFNLESELENPEFVKLINRNVDMEHAYKLLHLDELVKAAENAAAEKFSKSVQARAARPSENGLGNQSGVVVKSDVSKLTKKDRADIARRAARGERIEF